MTGAITRDSFANKQHQLIWQAMTEVIDLGEVINGGTIANQMDRTETLGQAGGLAYLISLDEHMPRVSDANLQSYVHVLRDKQRLRQIIDAARKTLAQVDSAEYLPDEIARNGQAMLAETMAGYGASQIESARSFVESYAGGVNMLLNPALGDRGIPTGFTEIDTRTGGFHAGEIFTIGARPASGKTAFGANITKTVAMSGIGVAVFSLELSKTMWLQRLICEEAYVSFTRFRQGELDEDERRRVRVATETIMDLPIYIDDTSGLSLADMRVKVNHVQAHHPLGLVVADYAQLFRPPKGVRYVNDNEKFTLVGEGIKSFCKDTRLPMLLLSQLNRESEKGKGDDKPKLSQCRGAGIWEEISFVGGCLYREYLRHRNRDDLRERAELLLEKNRSGPTADIPLRFQPHLMRFTDAGV